MTSPPNHLPQLSGSNLHILLIICLLGIGCASTSPPPTRGPVVLDPNHNSDEAQTDKTEIPIDTVHWKVVSEEESPPIMDAVDARVESYVLEKEKKSHYKVALMLPFRINGAVSVPDLSANNRKFANFYSGFKLAASAVSDVNISIKTYYTNRDINELEKILRDFSYDQPDLIIGSYESDIISQTADWARENRVPLISPWLSSTKITDNNLFYLQLRPSITNYYEKMLEHINYHFDEDDVYIITRDESRDQRMARILHRLNEEVSDRDESYVYSCLRKLYAEKGENDFYVYTMPLMLTSDRIDINILKNLQTRTCEFRFPDLRNDEVQRFRQRYYTSYGGLPTKDSYYGYDLMQFIEAGLKEYGQYFHYYMADEPLDLLQMKIDIQPYRKNEDDERPTFMANEHLYIIEYDTDHFVIKDIR